MPEKSSIRVPLGSRNASIEDTPGAQSRRQDVAAVVALMRAHIDHTKRCYLEILEQNDVLAQEVA